MEHLRRHQTEFGRASSYLVGDLTHSLLRARAVHPRVRDAGARPSLAKLLDACDAHSVSFLTAALADADEATGVVFAKVLEDYKQHRKYRGKV